MTNRFVTTTQKIERADTGLTGALYVHVQRKVTGEIHSIRFSHKSKDAGTLDRILVALGDATTGIIRDDDKPISDRQGGASSMGTTPDGNGEPNNRDDDD